MTSPRLGASRAFLRLLRRRLAQRLPASEHRLLLSVFVLAVTLMAVLGAISVGTMSTLRAYVGGESMWTKGEKQAVFHLVRYAQTRHPDEYEAALRAIAVPLADREARLAMEQPAVAPARAAEQLHLGGNHGDDIPGMIALFRHFGDLPPMDRAVAIWRRADQDLLQLRALADRLHVAVEADGADAFAAAPWVERIRAIDTRLTALEDEFSATLGEISRQARTVLIGTFAVLAALLVTLALAAVRVLARQAVAIERLRRESVHRLTLLAETDPLTGLSNRARYLERLATALLECRQPEWQLAVLFIDLDRFKQVNDTLGHAAGDVVLQKAAMRLRACAGHSDEVARLGGDEFALVLTQVAGRHQVAQTAGRIATALSRAFVLDGREVFVSASIGVAVFPGDGLDAGTLVRHADAAMYRAKASGRNGVQFYVHGSEQRGEARLALEADLHHALERGQLQLLFQPRRELASGRLCGLDAVLAWCHPQRGRVPPELFLPLLEDTGLIVPVGSWMLGEVCRQLRRWQDGGALLVPVAVRVTARQFRSGELDAALTQALHAAGTRPDLLELAINESVLMQDIEAAIRRLSRLRVAGVRLAVDDFGAGHSSLADLKRLPVDVLRIAGGFVRGLPASPADAAIVSAIIALARGLGLRTRVAGLDSAAQLEALRASGCDEGQGVLLAPPMDAGELGAWIGREHAGRQALV